jgi:hypothetical protein
MRTTFAILGRGMFHAMRCRVPNAAVLAFAVTLTAVAPAFGPSTAAQAADFKALEGRPARKGR